jgi:integrase/recombinase XerD
MNDLENHYQAFLKDLEVRNFSLETVRKYAHCVRLFLGYMNQKGIEDPRSIGREDLQGYARSLWKNTGWGVNHLAANIRAVKGFFRYLKKTKVVLYDFSVVLKEPKKPQTLPKEPLTAKEVRLMLDAPDLRKDLGFRDKAILETFYSTGLRVSEMARLTLLDVDLEGGLLNVREGKGKKDRVVPLGNHAGYFIGEYLQNVRPVLLSKNKTPQEVQTNRLWISKRGKPLGTFEIGWMVRHYRIKAGIEKQVTPHSFRRTLAVELIRNECDFLSVKSILGHSKSETTMRYCALSGADLKAALKRCHPRYATDETEDATPKIQSFG